MDVKKVCCIIRKLCNLRKNEENIPSYVHLVLCFSRFVRPYLLGISVYSPSRQDTSRSLVLSHYSIRIDNIPSFLKRFFDLLGQTPKSPNKCIDVGHRKKAHVLLLRPDNNLVLFNFLPFFFLFVQLLKCAFVDRFLGSTHRERDYSINYKRKNIS